MQRRNAMTSNIITCDVRAHLRNVSLNRFANSDTPGGRRYEMYPRAHSVTIQAMAWQHLSCRPITANNIAIFRCNGYLLVMLYRCIVLRPSMKIYCVI